jgi:hypothetical protein
MFESFRDLPLLLVGPAIIIALAASTAAFALIELRILKATIPAFRSLPTAQY